MSFRPSLPERRKQKLDGALSPELYLYSDKVRIVLRFGITVKVLKIMIVFLHDKNVWENLTPSLDAKSYLNSDTFLEVF